MRLIKSGTHEVWHSYPSTAMVYSPQVDGERRSALLRAAAECVPLGTRRVPCLNVRLTTSEVIHLAMLHASSASPSLAQLQTKLLEVAP